MDVTPPTALARILPAFCNIFRQIWGCPTMNDTVALEVEESRRYRICDVMVE